MIALANGPQVRSCVPGRIRVHLPGWTGPHAESLAARLGTLPGVTGVEANPLTGNVLIRWDCRRTRADNLLEAVGAVWAEWESEAGSLPDAGCRAGNGANRQGIGPALLQVGLRGLLGHAAVDCLWVGAGLLGSAVGLPLAWLGPAHVVSDIAVWGMAVASGIAAKDASDPREHAAAPAAG